MWPCRTAVAKETYGTSFTESRVFREQTAPQPTPHAPLTPYERPLVREDAHGTYSGSAHFRWIVIGEPTRQQGGAHTGLTQAAHNPHRCQAGADRVTGRRHRPEPDGAESRGRARTADLHHLLRREDVHRLLPLIRRHRRRVPDRVGAEVVRTGQSRRFRSPHRRQSYFHPVGPGATRPLAECQTHLSTGCPPNLIAQA
ncbi:3-deoxy-7-phosphoheptulonate synthase [Streptomyces graminilatus]|uniref:3-deoxy-7-phosphoheptulonate synthase n=1 Tax=Streptomyces graminilatus TaxID=1464070 RepID=UPI001F521143|nr:3-deoxy-7-phosphoheptulonate synthase [Streptomyces graminilatus]